MHVGAAMGIVRDRGLLLADCGADAATFWLRNGGNLRQRAFYGPSRDRRPAASNSFHRAVWPHGFGSVCDDRDDGIITTNDDLRALYKLAHDVSHRYDWVGASERLKLCRKRSMMRMTPPQSGQVGTLAHVRASESTGDGSPSFGAVRSRSRSLRQRASLAARWPLAMKPKWRMRWKPSGSV